MKHIKIRLGVFETNSSSTHSLTTVKDINEIASHLFNTIAEDQEEDVYDHKDDNTLIIRKLRGANGDENSYDLVIIETVWGRLSYIFDKILAMISRMKVTKVVNRFKDSEGNTVDIHSNMFEDVINWLESDDPKAKDIWSTIDKTFTEAGKKHYNCDDWTYDDDDFTETICEEEFLDDKGCISSDEYWTYDNYKKKIIEALDTTKLIVNEDRPYCNYTCNYKIRKY